MSSKLLMRDWSKTLLLHFKVINLAKVDSHGIFPPNQSQEPIQGSVKKQEAAKANEKQVCNFFIGALELMELFT